MNSILILIIFFLFLALIILFLFRKRNKKLSEENKKNIKKLFNDIKKSESYKEKMIDFDKLYHKILLGIGYKGTFGEILKNEPNEILNLNKIWELHKIRNRLVHNFDNHEVYTLKIKSQEYEKEIEIILKKI